MIYVRNYLLTINFKFYLRFRVVLIFLFLVNSYLLLIEEPRRASFRINSCAFAQAAKDSGVCSVSISEYYKCNAIFESRSLLLLLNTLEYTQHTWKHTNAFRTILEILVQPWEKACWQSNGVCHSVQKKSWLKRFFAFVLKLWQLIMCKQRNVHHRNKLILYWSFLVIKENSTHLEHVHTSYEQSYSNFVSIMTSNKA